MLHIFHIKHLSLTVACAGFPRESEAGEMGEMPWWHDDDMCVTLLIPLNSINQPPALHHTHTHALACHFEPSLNYICQSVFTKRPGFACRPQNFGPLQTETSKKKNQSRTKKTTSKSRIQADAEFRKSNVRTAACCSMHAGFLCSSSAAAWLISSLLALGWSTANTRSLTHLSLQSRHHRPHTPSK